MGGCRVGGPPSEPQFRRNCPGPCENDGQISEAPSATYSRGQTVNARWSRNNHEGGFVRWTIVKKSDMGNKDAHDRGTFAYTCWSSGRGGCRDNFECGSDQQKQAFSDSIVIPPIYPDGDYILGWVWFGGNGDFGEYYSCANIRIQGGPMQSTYTPVAKTCESTSDHVGQCPVEPCNMNGRPFINRIPRRFQNGSPAPLRSSDFGGAGGAPAPAPRPAPGPAPRPAPGPQQGGGIRNGGVYQIKSVSQPSKCIDASSSDDGAKVHSWDCHGGNNQKWRLNQREGGSWSLINVAAGNKGLDIWAGTQNGLKAQIWGYGGGENQRFHIVRDGNSYVIRVVQSGKALDLENNSGDNGASIQQYDYWGGSNQRWTFVAA